MSGFDGLVLQEQRHLKWRALDPLENVLMILCGVAITGFSVLVLCDIITRAIGHPWLWLQEATMTFFIYGIFIGVAAATRRNDHLYLAVLAESMTGNKRLFFEIFNRARRARGRALHDLFRLSQLSRRLQEPAHAVDDADGDALRGDPDLRRAGCAVHDRADGQRLAPRLSPTAPGARTKHREEVAVTANGMLIVLMGFLFLFLGYMGVPVAFALIASVLVVTAFTPVSQASMIAQLFNGMDVEALLAVPFFLLVGDLMTSANVTVRMITLSQTMVGHLRGGLAQVVTLFSMFFAGISGSSAADVAVLTRTLGAGNGPRRLRPRLHRRADRLGRDHGQPDPAQHHGGGLRRDRQRLDRRAVSRRRGAGRARRHRADDLQPFLRAGRHQAQARDLRRSSRTAAKRAAVPLMIPIIIMGGILTGQFTPTEAGIIAVAYIVFVAIPLLNLRHLPPSAARHGADRPALFDPADHHRRRVGVRLDAGLSARPGRGVGVDRARRRQRSVHDHAAAGRCCSSSSATSSTPSRPSSSSCRSSST